MPNTLFIDTNKLPRKQTPQGELTEILNNELRRKECSWHAPVAEIR